MKTDRYLHRIGLSEIPAPDTNVLHTLHRHHVMHVPFENLDIHFGKRFTMDPEAVYRKIVNEGRGGFCYELNLAFHLLLQRSGFTSQIISARIINELGIPGPAYDHMALHVKTDSDFLVDVGYGDLFITPLEIRTDVVQTDGRAYFRIDREDHDTYILLMSTDGHAFQKKYQFSMDPCDPSRFENLCVDKQVNPQSYFVQNVICTRATISGRRTIFNDRFTERNGAHHSDVLIENAEALRAILKSKFDITIAR